MSDKISKPKRNVRGAIIDRDRQKDDYYPTSKELTRVLLENEPPFVGKVWECACGEGWMSGVLETEYGLDVYSSDLRHTGYGEGGVDFLLQFGMTADHIVTNPPFKLFLPFLEKALSIIPDGGRVAFIVPIDYLSGLERLGVYKTTPLARVYVISRRATFVSEGKEKTGSGMMNYIWLVWEKGREIGRRAEIDFFDQKTYLKDGEFLDGAPLTRKTKEATQRPDFPLLEAVENV